MKWLGRLAKRMKDKRHSKIATLGAASPLADIDTNSRGGQFVIFAFQGRNGPGCMIFKVTINSSQSSPKQRHIRVSYRVRDSSGNFSCADQLLSKLFKMRCRLGDIQNNP